MNSESRMPGDWPVRFGRGRIFAYLVFTHKYPSKCFYPHIDSQHLINLEEETLKETIAYQKSGSKKFK
ncbi:MAG: hypothetical protein Q8899_01340 [Weeping tea tree witches'-broom phytoplasma]|nr:hypothetical protein [Weeping tea tree witches'-broom phytoplasma]